MSYGDMLIVTARAMPKLVIQTMRGRGHHLRARTELVERAIDWQADAMLLLDDDHKFPPDAALRLMRHDLDFVGVNQPRRSEPTEFSATDFQLRPVRTTKAKADAGLVEEVRHNGLALCLIRMSVIEAIRRQHKGPLFQFEPMGDGFKTEDVYFCELARAAGINIHVDHALSRETGHVDERILTTDDALREPRAAFDAIVEQAERGVNAATVRAPAGHQ